MTTTSTLASSFRQRMRARDAQLRGLLLRMPNLVVVELSGLVGLDFVLIDCEHGPADSELLNHHVLAATAAGLPAIVRVGDVASAEVLRALALGAAGIVAPHIDTPDDARAFVAALRHSPAGRRGFATYTRAGDHGLVDPASHAARADSAVTAIAMIESQAALANAREIAGVPGLDALLPGPADLRHDLSTDAGDVRWSVDEAQATIWQAAAKQGLCAGMITNSAAAAPEPGDVQLLVYNFQVELNDLMRRLA